MKKIIYPIIITLIFIICMPMYVKAENSKEIQLPIAKNYKSAKFEMDFEYYDNYQVVVESPSGNKYNATYVGGTQAECIVNDVEVGQWKITITKPESEVVSSDDDSTEDESSRDISKVKIQVEGSMESLVDVNKDITVVTDITGLKQYFKDDSFVVEWTDTECGNVYIEVINAKNMQKLDAQTISTNYYSLELSPDIDEIMVNIVPSVSAGIEGATKSYTFKVDNNPKAKVTYEDLPITNHDSLKITCELEDKYGVKIFVNDKEVESTEILNEGLHEFEAPLDLGDNHIVTYIVDNKGNMRSNSYDAIKDVVAPSLNLVSDYNNIVTDNETLTIEGAVEDCDNLTINNDRVEIERDNTFKYDYKLQEGSNKISIVASDQAGNESAYDIEVERKAAKKNDISTTKLFGIIVIFIIFIYLLFRKSKKIRRDTKETVVMKAGSDQTNENKIDKIEKKPKKVNDRKKNQEKISSSEDRKKIKAQTQENMSNKIKKCNQIYRMGSFIIPLIAVYVILSNVILVSCVSSGSMQPNLKVGNTVIYNRLAYVNKSPDRGEVVVFYSDEYKALFAKRIIGIPGDHIQFKDGYVVINGQYCEESYIDDDIETNCIKEFTVPDDCYFMLGDNREKSKDSRYWQNPYIEKSKIIGEYMGQLDFSIQYDIINKIIK